MTASDVRSHAERFLSRPEFGDYVNAAGAAIGAMLCTAMVAPATILVRAAASLDSVAPQVANDTRFVGIVLVGAMLGGAAALGRAACRSLSADQRVRDMSLTDRALFRQPGRLAQPQT